MIGRLGAEVLRGAIRDGAVVGIGDGASISAVADALAADEPLHETGATVVPLCGGYWFSGPAREPFRRVADAIGGVAASGSSRPGLVDDPATKRSLVAHAGVRRILDLWDRLDVAVFGIGGPAWSEAALGPRRRRRARAGDAVGEVLDRAVRHRRPVRRRRAARTARSRSTRGRLDRIPVRIGVAGGRGQGPADPRRAARRHADDARDRRRRRPRRSLGWPRRRRRGGRRGLMAATSREAAVLAHRPRHDRGQGRPRHASTAACSASRGRATATDVDPATGRAEQDPEAWWGALAPGGPRARPRLDAGEVSRSGSTATARRSSRSTPTDAADPSRDHLAGHARRPRRRPSSRRRRGSRAGRSAVLPAALWLERNEPAAAAATRWYLATWDALAPAADRPGGDEPRRGPAVPGRGRARIGSACPPRRSRPAVRAGTVVGELLPDAAARTSGCAPASRSSPGIVDAFASFHGAGMTARPATRSTSAARPAASGSTGIGRWSCPAASRRSRRCPGCLASAGRWPRPAARSTGSGLDDPRRRRLDRGADRGGRPRSPPGADGLVFLPYLAGERSPLWDPSARGAFVGLDARPRPRAT